MRVAVTGSVAGADLMPSLALTPRLVFSDGPGRFPVRLQGEFDGEEMRFLAPLPVGRFVVGHEVVGLRQFGRHRSMLEPLGLEGAGVSDLLLFEPDAGPPPQDLEAAAQLMLVGILPGVGTGNVVSVDWEDVSTGAAQGRNHTLDLSALDPGTYTLVLRTRWADEETIEVRRPYEIR